MKFIRCCSFNPFASIKSLLVSPETAPPIVIDPLKSFIPAFHVEELPQSFIPTRNYEKIDLGALKLVLQNEKLQENADLKTFIEDYLEDGKFRKTFNYIKQSIYESLPTRISEKCIQPVFNQLYHYFNILGLIGLPLNMLGTNRLSLLSRSNHLQERKEIYKERLNNYLILLINQVTTGNSLNAEDLKAEKNWLESEKIKIKVKESHIRTDYIKYLLNLAKYFISNVAFILSFSPFKSLIDLGLIVSKTAGLTEALDVGLASLTLREAKSREKICQSWEENFKRGYDKPTLEIKSEEIKVFESRPNSINNEEIQNLEWDEIKIQFDNFQEEEGARLSELINNSRLLIEKRQLEKDQKILQLGVLPDIEERVRAHFVRMHPTKNEGELEEWMSNQSPLSLLNLYVDQQSTIELLTVNAFNQMIDKKLELEKKFLGLRSSQSHFFFWYSTFSLAVAVVGGVIGSIAGPIGGVSGLFIGLAVTSIILNLSFWITNYLLGSKYRSHSSGFLNFKIMIANIRYEVSNYWLKVQQEDLLAKNPLALSLIETGDRTLILDGITEEEAQKFRNRHEDTKELLKDLALLKEQRRNKEWIDFKNYAAGEENGDNQTLIEGLIEGLRLMDFDLINAGSKHTLEFAGGFNLSEIRKELETDQPEIRENALTIIKRDLMNLFNLDDMAFGSFMSHQLEVKIESSK